MLTINFKLWLIPCLLACQLLSAQSLNEPKTILVVGGAGYIGSYVDKLLHQQGYSTLVLDDLSRGNAENVRYGELIIGNMGDSELLHEIFTENNISAVMLFAASTAVDESILHPRSYYNNNIINTLHLLNAMVDHQIPYLIFSSSCAIFGEANKIPIEENHPKNPINPYGETKLYVENILKSYDKAYNLKYCALRYFNVAGGDPEGEIKISTKKMTNLIPVLLNSVKYNQTFTIYGNDYPTPDGTCIRDYIHIHDLAEAHILALRHLLKKKSSSAYNLGNGSGFSVKEVIQAVEKVTRQKVSYTIGPRRPGDPPSITANLKEAKKELGWNPIYSNLEKMVSDAWKSSL